jgi:hypothetical protein
VFSAKGAALNQKAWGNAPRIREIPNVDSAESVIHFWRTGLRTRAHLIRAFSACVCFDQNFLGRCPRLKLTLHLWR